MFRPRLHRRTWYLLLVFASGLALTWAMHDLARRQTESDLHAQTDVLAREIGRLIQHRSDDYIHFLRGIGMVFSHSEDVTAAEFAAAVDHGWHRGIGFLAVEWAPRLSRDQLPAWQRYLSDQGLPPLHLTSAAGPNRLAADDAAENEIQPVSYLVPFEENRRAYGYNILSGVNRALIESARENNRVTISRLTALIGPTDSLGFAIYAPVRRNSDPAQDFLGHVVGIVELEAFMTGIFSPLATGEAEVLFVDRTPGGASGPIALRDAEGRVITSGLPAQQVFSGPYTRTFEVAHMERVWEVVARPTAAWLENHRSVADSLVLLLGLVATLGATAITWHRNRYIHRIEAGMQERQQQLERMAAEIRGLMTNSPYPIFLKSLDRRYLAVNPPFAEVHDRDPEDFVGRTDEELFPPEIAARFRARDDETLHKRLTLQFEDVITVHGIRRRFLVSKFPLRHTDGTLYGIGGIATDLATAARRGDAGAMPPV